MDAKRNKIKSNVILVCLVTIVIAIVVGIIIGFFIYNFFGRDNEQQIGDLNTLYGYETQNNEEGNTMVVPLDTNSSPNEENVNEGNNTAEAPKEVEIPYYIKVNNQANVVTVYKKDSNGRYTVPIKTMICSIGIATPESGVYTISDKYTWRLLEGNVYGQYACRIVDSILFHSVPYKEKDKSTLEWWEYDKLGTSASLGCVRLTVSDAKWIYDNCIPGTKVEFYSSSTPRTSWKTNC